MKYDKLPKDAKVKIEGSIFVFERYYKSRILLRNPDKSIALSLRDTTEFVKKKGFYALKKPTTIVKVDALDTAEMRAVRLFNFILFIVKLVLGGTFILAFWRYMGWI